jgi:hypothetical protein
MPSETKINPAITRAYKVGTAVVFMMDFMVSCIDGIIDQYKYHTMKGLLNGLFEKNRVLMLHGYGMITEYTH